VPRRINLGQGLVVIGALALLVSLFLDWYEVGAFGGDAVSAWTVFEIADLVLASLAVLAIAGAVPARLGAPEPRSLIDARWLPWVGVAALIFIVATLLNDPPAVRDRSPEIGVWVGLAGAALLTAGGLLSGSRISVVISTRPSEAPAATRPATATHPLEHEPTQPVDVDRSTEEWLPPEDERA
jgi:hypothetical protein